MVLNILAFVLLLITLQPPLADGTFPLQQRLLPDFHGCTFYGRDVFTLLSGQAWLFWRNTGETPGSFLRLALNLLPTLSSLTACGQPRITPRRQKITLINQVLLTIIAKISVASSIVINMPTREPLTGETKSSFV